MKDALFNEMYTEHKILLSLHSQFLFRCAPQDLTIKVLVKPSEGRGELTAQGLVLQ